MAVTKILNYSAVTFTCLLVFASTIGNVKVRAAMTCPDGWTADNTTDPTSCYMVDCTTTAVAGGDAADTACNTVLTGAKAASVLTDAENGAVKTAIEAGAATCNSEDDYWLGGAETGDGSACVADNDLKDCAEILWSDERTKLQGGYDKFPANEKATTDIDCVAYKLSDQTWLAAKCADANVKKYPVCRTAATDSSTGTGSGSSDAKSSCLFGGDRVGARGEGKLVAEVQAGDVVWSVDELRGRLVQDEVYVMVHADPYLRMTFTDIRTTGDKRVRLTGEHMILTADGGEKTAERVVPGDQIYVHDEMSGLMKLERVQSVQEDKQTGIYNPITRSGRIMVNGVLVSTYPQYQGVSAAGLHTGMWLMRMLYEMCPGVVSAGGGGGMPMWARYAMMAVDTITTSLLQSIIL